MNCPICGREVPARATSCPSCSSVTTPGTEDLAVPVAPASARPASKYSWAFRLGAWALSLGCWYIIVIMSMVLATRIGGPLAETFLRLIVGIVLAFLLPLIGVSLYYRKKTPRPPLHRRVLLVSAFALVFSFLSNRGSWYSSTSLTQERLGILVKEGAGLLPVSRDQSVWDSPARRFFADVAEFGRQYQEEAHKLDQSVLNSLYSPDSFQDATHMEKVLTQLRAYLALQEKYASLDPILERTKARIRSVDAPDSVKEQILSGFSGSPQVTLINRNALFAKVEAWIRSSIDLYEFTLARRASYALRDGKLVFKNRDVMSEFNERLKEALARRADALQAQENFEQSQKGDLRKFNMQPSDVVFSQKSPRASKLK